jgi:outer membrane protein assembly factor BamB
VTNGKVVVAYFGSEGLYAYSTAGELLWKKDLGLQNAGWFFDPDSEWGAASSPVIYKNMVILQCDRQKDSFIAAFDLKDGRELWRTARAEIPSWGTPTIVAGKDHTEVATNGPKPSVVTTPIPANNSGPWDRIPKSLAPRRSPRKG